MAIVCRTAWRQRRPWYPRTGPASRCFTDLHSTPFPAPRTFPSVTRYGEIGRVRGELSSCALPDADASYPPTAFPALGVGSGAVGGPAAVCPRPHRDGESCGCLPLAASTGQGTEPTVGRRARRRHQARPQRHPRGSLGARAERPHPTPRRRPARHRRHPKSMAAGRCDAGQLGQHQPPHDTRRSRLEPAETHATGPPRSAPGDPMAAGGQRAIDQGREFGPQGGKDADPVARPTAPACARHRTRLSYARPR